MAPKTHKIHVKVPAALNLTQAEKAKLKKIYGSGIAQVLKARGGDDPPPFTEGNITGGGQRTNRKKGKKTAAKAKKR